MNRHLVVVELDARLFDASDQTAAFVERAVAVALIAEAPPNIGEVVDLRPVVSFTTTHGVQTTFRFLDTPMFEGADRRGDAVQSYDADQRVLGMFSTATLLAELNERAENGLTDRGLDFTPVVNVP